MNNQSNQDLLLSLRDEQTGRAYRALSDVGEYSRSD